MKVPQTRYKIHSFYGNTDWHVVNREDEDLSIKNPFAIYIGITTEVDLSFGAFTKLQSNWLWRHSFQNRGSNNWYSSSNANGSNSSGQSITTLNVGITSTSTYYSVGNDNAVLDGYITTGTDGAQKTHISTIRFYSGTDWYFTPSVTVPNNTSDSAMVFKFSAPYTSDLPSSMYSINDRTIIWNTLNPVYKLLYGQECFTA